MEVIYIFFVSTGFSRISQKVFKRPFIATRLSLTQLNSTRQREQQLTQFVGHVINKNKIDLAVRCSTGSVEFS